jgi:serine/threonine protein kinase/WD40 repeat protein
MGVVFKARQISLDRLVAVKLILSGHFAGRDSIQRFRTEASAAAALQHPNIVAIHEVGVHQGEHYLAMDLVEGPNLAQLAKNEPLPAPRAARYIKTIAEAIHYAHERGILHRDLKPSNVLIDAHDQPRVTDFGLAKRIVAADVTRRNSTSGSQGARERAGEVSTDPAGSSHSLTASLDRSRPSEDQCLPTPAAPEITLTGQVLGSPNYIAPEQASGKRGQVSRRSDVYSLGAILYHLLTGRGPFISDTVAETLQLVLHEEPAAPRVLNPRVRRDLETICLKCMQKDPSRRYPTAQELAEDLGRFIRDEAIHARPVSRAGKVWRWCRRKPALASLGAVSFALLLIVLIGLPIALYQIDRARRQAEQNARNESLQRQRADEELWNSYLDQARANRWSGRAGRRFDSLEAVKKASEMRPSLELRNEAIAAMTLPDLQLVRDWEPPPSVYIRMASDRSLQRYAFADARGDVVVRDVARNETVGALESQNLPVRQMCFSADDRYLAVGYARDRPWQAKVCVWDLERQEVVLTIPDHSVEKRLDFNPRRPELALADDDGSIFLYDVPQRKLSRHLTGDLCPSTISYAPDGEHMAVAIAHQPLVQIRNVKSGELLRTLTHGGEVMEAAWHGHGRLLATACLDRQVYLWDIDTWETVGVLQGHQDGVYSVAFTQDGDFLMSCGADHTLHLWDLSSRSPVVSLANPNPSVVSVPRAEGRRIGLTRRNGVVHLIEFEKARECPTFGRGTTLTDASFHPEGQIAAAAHTDGVFIFDTGGVELGFISFHGCRSVMFTADGNSLLIAGASGLQRLPLKKAGSGSDAGPTIGPPERIELAAWQPDAGPVSDLCPLADGKRVAVCLQNQAVVILDPSAPADARVLNRHRRENVVAASSDGQWAAVGTERGSGVAVWDATSGEAQLVLPVNDSATVAFSPDSQWLVTGTRSQYRFWKTGTWELQRVVPSAYPRALPGMAFSPDGTLFAMAKTPTTMELMDARTGAVLATLPTGVPGPRCFSADGTKLLAGAEQGGVRIWDLRQIRERLAALNLDWNEPPYPPGSEASAPPLIEVLMK